MWRLAVEFIWENRKEDCVMGKVNPKYVEVNNEAKRLHDVWRETGERVDRDAYVIFVLESLEGLLMKESRLICDTTNIEYEEIRQEFSAIVLENIERYDPHYTFLSTFFQPYVKQAIRVTFKNTKGVNGNLLKNAQYLTKLCHEYYGKEITEVDIVELQKISGIRMDAVEAVVRYRRAYNDSLEKLSEDENFEVPAVSFGSPELSFIEQETNCLLAKEIDKLPKADKFIVESMMEKDKPSVKKICLEVNHHLNFFDLKKPISNNDVYRAYNSFIEKTKQNKSLMKKLSADIRLDRDYDDDTDYDLLNFDDLLAVDF